MTTVNYYRVHCDTDNVDRYVWSTDTPTTCPDNISHTIDPTKTVILDTVSTLQVETIEPTEGLFQVEGITIDVPAGTPGYKYEYNYSWPHDIYLWRNEFTIKSDMIGDNFSIVIRPEQTIGYLTANAEISDTVLNVNSTVTTNIHKGMYVILDNGVDKKEYGRCINANSTSGTITVETPLDQQFLTETLVKVDTYLAKNINLNDDKNTLKFAQKGFKGKTIEANTILCIRHNNMDGNAKSYDVRVEYYY